MLLTVPQPYDFRLSTVRFRDFARRVPPDGLALCTLQSLRFHTDRVGIDFLAKGSASGVVTKRADDGRYAFVDLDVEIDLELEPVPAREELTALLAKAERDCFVGASLKPSPRYRWRVNGAQI